MNFSFGKRSDAVSTVVRRWRNERLHKPLSHVTHTTPLCSFLTGLMFSHRVRWHACVGQHRSFAAEVTATTHALLSTCSGAAGRLGALLSRGSVAVPCLLTVSVALKFPVLFAHTMHVTKFDDHIIGGSLHRHSKPSRWQDAELLLHAGSTGQLHKHCKIIRSQAGSSDMREKNRVKTARTSRADVSFLRHNVTLQHQQHQPCSTTCVMYNTRYATEQLQRRACHLLVVFF